MVAGMANDKRRGHKVKDDESTKLRKKIVTKDASPASILGPSDTSSLRRSSRETSSRKQTKESPNTRKSERLEKRKPSSALPMKKKSERSQKQVVADLMKRSDKDKKRNSSGSLDLKNFVEQPTPSNMKSKKEKVRRSLKQSMVDASVDSIQEKQGLDVGGRKRKRAATHVSKALSKHQRLRTEAGDDNDKESQDKLSQAKSSSNEDLDKVMKRPDELRQLDDSKNEDSATKSVEEKDGGVDECSDKMGEESSMKTFKRQRRASYSGLRNFDAKEENGQVEVEGSDLRRKFSSVEGHKASVNSRKAEGVPHHVVNEPLDNGLMDLEQAGHVGCSSRKSINSESIKSGNKAPIGGKGSSSERETSTRKTDSDTCANVKDNPISHRSPSSGCKGHEHDETCVACSEKPRTYDGLGKQQELDYCNMTCDTDIQNTSSSKDRRTCEAAGLTEIVEKNDAMSRMGASICIACKLSGKLRRCDAVGCNRCYHLSCLDPPVNGSPLNRRCPFCVKNIKSGVPSVIRVAESVWDTREVEVSDAEGLRKQKQYFVKYKGLAHIHNRWITETQLLLEAPLLVETFNKNDVMMLKWIEAWTVPHQLLKKRLLLSFEPPCGNQQNAGKVLNFHYEWLVKWQGLDYEQATWESENSSVLDSSEGANLIKEYENHHGKENISASPVDKMEELPVKLPAIPVGCCPPGMDDIHLSYIKNLHDAWNTGQNSVVFDDQEWIMRIVLFILSLKGLTLPFLLITTAKSLSRWEAMFLRVAPCNDSKVSIEDKEGQRSARLLEIQKEDGQFIFQVLLCPVDAFVKDLNVLKAVKWEAVIVDESQSSEISTNFSHIKSLSTNKRLLVFCGPLCVNMAGYLDLLSLLGCDGALHSCVISKTELDDISKLKETLSGFIAYECKSSSSKFVEFWVPVQISNVQLEQYCSVLLSNAMALCSFSKSDTVGALHDILVSNRKCCDHPYIVDPFLQGVITKDLEPAKFLDVGIKASGKLQFLDLILPEMRKRQLRVLILFQPLSGSGRDSISIGDILDDFVRQRFGEDSYERVDGIGTVPSKKQAALNNFNNKDMGRFIFLLEYRACLPSIKLSSVDAVIIFDSDWNPANDLRALQKITIDAQSEQVMIFRLYISWTLEEKILRLAEHNVTIDSKLQNLSRSTSDALLMWGASHLFDKLAEFHSASLHNTSSEECFWNKLVEEFLNLISHKYKVSDSPNLMITRVQLSGGTYNKNLPLPSEQITQLPDRVPPHTFWRKLFEGRNPHWKFLSESTPRQRKRPQYFENLPEKTKAGNDDVGSKRKKAANNITESAASKPVMEEGEIGGAYTGTSEVPSHDGSQFSPDDSFGCAATCNETSFHHLLKLNITKLCKVLKLSEDVKIIVERFLEYVIENYRVNKEPASTLQAFLISLCWIGSALLKNKLDRRQSLTLAKKHLNFSCKEEEANSVYLKLEPAKEMFLRHTNNQKKTDVSKDSIPASLATSTESLDPTASHSGPFNPQVVKVEILENPHEYVDDVRIILEHGRSEIQKLPNEETLLCSKRMTSENEKRKENLAEKHKKEIDNFNREWDRMRVYLENGYKVDKAFICNLHNNPSVRSEKLKSLDNAFANKMDALERRRRIHLKDLKAMQQAAEGCMSALSNSSDCEGKALNELPLHGSQHEDEMVFFGTCEDGVEDCPRNGPTSSRNPTEVHGPDKPVHDMHPTLVVPADIVTSTNGTAGGSIRAEAILSHKDPNSASSAVNVMSLKLVGAIIEDQSNRGGCAKTGTENIEVDGSVFEELPGNKEQSKRLGISNNSANNIQPTSSHTSVEQIADVTVSGVPADEIPAKTHEGVPSDVVKQVDSVRMSVLAADCNQKITDAGTIFPDASQDGEDQNDISPNDIERHAGSVGMGVLVVDSSEKNAETCNISPDASDALEDQNDSCSSSNSNSSSVAASKEKVPSVQPFISPASGQSIPTNLEIQNESIQGKEVQGNPSSLSEINNLQPIDAGQVDRFTSDDSSLDPHEEPCFALLANPAVSENESNIPPANKVVLQTTGEEQILPCDSDHTMLQSRLNLEEHPLASAEAPLAEQQPDLHLADRVDCQPNGELHDPSQNPKAPPQVLENTAEISNQDATPPAPNVSNVQRSDNHNQGASRMLNRSPFSSDPLQAELEKLRELKDTVIKCHEDIKVKLKSDHEKELAETIAQINLKYEAKRHDAEVAFQLKKKEVDINLNRVAMNKILAEAFRSKCQDLIPSDPAGIQVTQSRLIQHLCQSPVQPSLRHSAGLTSSAPPQSSGNQQVTMLQQPLQIVHQPAELFSSTPSRPSSNTTPSSMPSGRPSNANPITPSSTPSRQPPIINPITPTAQIRPLPPVNPILPSSNTPSRPPLNISPISPSARNLRGRSEIRAPAPHIRPFRPSTSVSPHDRVSQRVMPSEYVSSSGVLSSPTFSQHSARPPLPPSVQLPPPLLTNHNGLPSHSSPSRLPVACPLLVQASSQQPPPPIPQPASFRPPSLSAAHHSSLPSEQRVPGSPPATSSSHPQAKRQILPPPIPSVSISNSGLYSASPRHDSGPLLPTPDILSLPALDLLMNIDDWAGGRQPNILPPPPDLGTTNVVSDPTEFGKGGGACTNNSVANDLVCLSDDD